MTPGPSVATPPFKIDVDHVGKRFDADGPALAPVLFCEQTKQYKALAQAIWNDYSFDPTFGSEYVKDMDLTTQYLLATGRVKTAKNPLDYTYTAPLAALEPGLVKVPGQFKP